MSDAPAPEKHDHRPGAAITFLLLVLSVVAFVCYPNPALWILAGVLYRLTVFLTPFDLLPPFYRHETFLSKLGTFLFWPFFPLGAASWMKPPLRLQQGQSAE